MVQRNLQSGIRHEKGEVDCSLEGVQVRLASYLLNLVAFVVRGFVKERDTLGPEGGHLRS
jgi:hypothetical protein